MVALFGQVSPDFKNLIGYDVKIPASSIYCPGISLRRILYPGLLFRGNQRGSNRRR